MKEFVKSLENSFFGFWVKNYKLSFLFVVLIVFLGGSAIYQIPKESTPEIEIPVLQINTSYAWVNADDIDSLITDKIVRQLQWVDWIRQIDATSSLWVSSITVELFDNIDPREKLITVEDEVDQVDLPSDADDPSVSDITTENQLIFNLVLYSQDYSQDELKEKAREVRDQFEWRWGVANIDVVWSADYDYEINVNQDELDSIWLSINDISDVLEAYHTNTPLWNYTVDDFDYDFRIEWEVDDIQELMDLVIHGQDWSYVKLQDVASYQKKYDDDAKRFAWLIQDSKRYSSVSLEFEKDQQTSIFAASNFAKSEIDKLINSTEFAWINYFYTSDLAALIIEDYETLAENWLITLVLVFALLFLFIWFKQSILASLALPLAFMITFFVLNQLGYTMNFLTNFSLVLSFWIAIDVIIVIVEWASQKIRLWYSPKNAILLAIRDLWRPMTSWAATTLAVFLPLIFLPGMMWNFLAYIPVTVFSVVFAAWLLSLTLNSAIFYKLNKDPKCYFGNPGAEELLSKQERELLEHDRKWKYEKTEWKQKKDVFFDFLQDWYANLLWIIMRNKFTRLTTIWIPVVLLVLSFIFLSPRIGFTLFPSSDTDFMQVSIEWPSGISSEYMSEYTSWFESKFNDIMEIEDYSYYVDSDTIWLDINLLSVSERENMNLWNVYDVEEKVLEKLQHLENKWMSISTQIQDGWPPQDSEPIWVRLVADSIEYFDKLLEVGDDFEYWLERREWIWDISISSDELPGQYVYSFDNYALEEFDLTPDVVSNQVFSYLDWNKIWSISRWQDEFDIVVKSDQFWDKINPADVDNIPVWEGVQFGDVAEVKLDRAVDEINRRDQNIVLSIWWDLARGYEARTAEIQWDFRQFAQEYDYPEWISFEEAWEAQENQELIIWVVEAFVIWMLAIFSILVLQFNSFSKPLMILYSVVLAVLWVNVWLWATWNPYSMPFGIGFVALAWIVVNNAIILIDRISSNLENTEDNMKALLESWRSRLRPIILTTLTTIFGILPLALEDEFWASLGFTVIFGLAFGWLMTLFVIPAIYYEFFIKEKKWFIRRFLGWITKFFRKQE